MNDQYWKLFNLEDHARRKMKFSITQFWITRYFVHIQMK